ncbi:granulin a [Odontesthes bonariensis]|uniref:granulin a n=1 Tax=Odontesthes bonariensis TaxID=219752 RepID=UPI003F58BE04
MQRWVVICWALLALVGAEECPDGGRCHEGHTCCNSPTNGYGCCLFDQAECCEDHIHCCPADTLCNTATSSCVNATVSIPWMERTSADEPTFSKSFRMIKTYMGEDDDNICPDLSRCPAEFSCLKALTKFGCCPLAKGVSCSDGKHCCPEGHQCSIDSRSCIKKELVTTVLCNDGVSECPDDTTCCETPEGKWGCCPMPKAVCCNDKQHCCPEGTTCDIGHMKCVSPYTKKELPMWAKFPARIREDWENQKDSEIEVTAIAVEDTEKEKNPDVTTANPVPLSKEEVPVSSVAEAEAVNDVPCNDTAACPDGTSCCKTKEGGWACCPLPEAVCCEDFTHCCPKGKTCNLAERTCDDNTCSIPWVEKVPTILRQSVQVQLKDVPCDDTTGCPDGTTCCKTKEGGWACCPLPEAVCCEDFTHCCPKGKKCNVAAQKCEDGLFSLPWVEKIPSIPRQSVQVQLKDVPCDDTTGCPDGTTCCKTKEGGWACCPLPEAVCCEDFTHCCPKGKKCNVAAQKCEDGLFSLPWVEKIPSIPRQSVQVQLKDVPCDDTTGCSDGTTCCKTKEGGWACCPLPEAVCCEDFTHCCPKGKKCNVAAQKCEDGLFSLPWVEKIPSIPRQSVQVQLKDVPCDDTTGCPDGTTCCKTKEGGWACCPLPEAVCCEDFTHCCPKGKKCNVAAQKCEDGLFSLPWVEKIPSIPRQSVQVQLKDVPCDDTTGCPDGTTCCKTKEGGWACCPLPEAVCCEDFTHCCPKGKKCNVAAQKCEDGLISLPWVEKIPSIPRQSVQVQLKDVPCDDTTGCPDGTTCCKTKEGGWACCPLPEAVCCEDFTHCCPKGKKCNVAAQKCEDGLFSLPWVEKIPSIPRQSVQVQLKDVPCDDTTGCPDGTTCCKTKEGGWACCPLPEAVCCEDFTHCCPKGKKCNVAAQKCEDGLFSLPWVEKIPSIPRLGAQMQNVSCDSSSSCPDGTTCCKTKEGGWACCPLPQAVCCEDHEHCCPTGTTCDLATLTCNSALGSTPMKQKIPAFPSAETGEEMTAQEADYDEEEEDVEDEEEEDVDDEEDEKNTEVEGGIQCDAHTSCPQHTTCCFMASSKKWGCCPLPKAVCCADGDHCCPNNYKCDESQTSCIKGEVVIPWYTKITATTSVQADSSSVQCDDGNRCPEHTSCCRLFTGQWGCCPLQNAVCCPDKEHCCPQGYTCDIASMSCHKLIMLQLETVPLTPVYLPEYKLPFTPLKNTVIKCDDQISCNDDETCCRMSDTTWGCCPSPKAVCCSDMKHCCPDGYSCTDAGSCTQNVGLNWHNWHVFLANKKRALIV